MSTNSKQLSPGELAVGMFVTVLDNAPYTKEEVTGGVFAEAKVITTTSHDRSGYGEVLIILAIDLPYVAVRYEDEYESDRFVTKIDTCGGLWGNCEFDMIANANIKQV